jgi:hypothetical protein
VECGLIQLGRLERLDMGKAFSTFLLAYWASCPQEIGVDIVNMLFPAATLPLKLIYLKP